jgi:RNA polymerase sigma factor (sigma-70 family)
VDEVLSIDGALSALAKVDERKARVVELRVFAGLTVEESAHVLGVSAITVARDWRFARSWLQRELTR